MRPVLITIMNKHSFEREYYECLYELGHFYYLIQDDEDLNHYLYNLYLDMRDDNLKSGIFVTSHNLSLPEYAHYLRTFATTNRVRFIIIK